jgi:uncharacterized protein (TIGR03066 family)
MRWLLGCVVIIGLTSIGAAIETDKKTDDKKVDKAAKLIGKWAPISNKKVVKDLVEEFTKDGKYYMGPKGGGRTEGTYKLDGDELTIMTNREGSKDTQKRTIKKISDTDLELNFGGKTVPYKRIK